MYCINKAQTLPLCTNLMNLMENLRIPNSTFIFCPTLIYFPYFVGSLFHTLLGEVWGNSGVDDSGKPYSLSPAVRK